MEDRTQIGTVISASPGKRRLRIEMPQSYVAYALSLSILECKQKDGSILKCRVASSTKTGDGIAVTVVPGVPRDTVAQLKNNRIVAPQNEIVRDAKHYDAKELTGLSVYDAQETKVGIVASGFETRANAMVQLHLENGVEIVLPVVPEVVKRIDWSSKSIMLMQEVPLDGAIDSNQDDSMHA